MSIGTLTVADALDSAVVELGLGSPDDAEPTSPVEDAEATEPVEQADAEESGQPDSESQSEDAESLFDEDLVPADDDASSEAATVENLLDARVDVPGHGELSVAELKDGYLRQADYTRKTQELADARKANADAAEFWEQFQSDPVGVARAIAVRAGLINEGDQPVRGDIPLSPLRTQEDVDAEVERRVAERLEQHPSVQEAKLAEAQRVVDSEFARIEEAHGVSLAKSDRDAVMREAQRRGVADLELVFLGLLQAQREKEARAESLKQGAPSRPAPRGVDQSTPAVERVTSVEDAFALALAEATNS